jgi:hypothetical protein
VLLKAKFIKKEDNRAYPKLNLNSHRQEPNLQTEPEISFYNSVHVLSFHFLYTVDLVQSDT